MAKVKLRHIPYRGSAPALQGLLAGDVDVMFDNLGVSLAAGPGRQAEAARGGLIRTPAGACLTYRRWPKRCQDSEAVAWYGIVAPPRTPKDDHRQRSMPT